MDKVLSISTLLSVIWPNFLLNIIMRIKYFDGEPGTVEHGRMLAVMYIVYFIVLLFNIYAMSYCQKVQEERETSKIPCVISIVGTTIYIIFIFFVLFAYTAVHFAGDI